VRASRHALAAGLYLVGAVLSAALAFSALAQDGQAAQVEQTEQRIRALEDVVRALTVELEALRREVARGAAPAPEAVRDTAASRASAEREADRRKVRDIEFDVQQTRDTVGTLQGRLDSQVPMARLADGVIIEDAAGRWALRATARMQVDYRDFSVADVGAETFSIRRARTGLGFTMGRVFTLFVEAEHSLGANTQSGVPANGVLHQAYMDFALHPALRLRVGQFRPQFGLEATTPTWLVDFQERSLAAALVQAPQNNVLFDRGLMISGLPWAGVNYGLSVTNGTGTNLDELDRGREESRAQGKDFSARLTANAAEWLAFDEWVFHGGVSWKSGEQANFCSTSAGVTPCGYRAPSAITEARGVTFFNPRPFNATGSSASASTVDRIIQGIEAALAYRGLKVQGEVFQANYRGAPPGGAPFDRAIHTGYVATNWLVTGEHFASAYRSGIFGRIRPDNQFATGPGGGWGALEAGLRYSWWDASDFQAGSVADVSGVMGGNTLAPAVSQSTNRANAWTVALKWMPTAYVAYMVNYVHTNFGSRVVANDVALDNERALTLRAQFDLF
jgi:phosphate-selective porin OprO/OprP